MIFKGEEDTFREVYFSVVVQDSLWSSSLAKDKMGPKRIESPQGKETTERFSELQ